MKIEIYKINNVFAWENQAKQYPPNGDGIQYFNGKMEDDMWVDCLLFYGDDHVLEGILNHYPFDFPPHEKQGNINIHVRPDKIWSGIATALLDKARSRFKLVSIEHDKRILCSAIEFEILSHINNISEVDEDPIINFFGEKDEIMDEILSFLTYDFTYLLTVALDESGYDEELRSKNGKRIKLEKAGALDIFDIRELLELAKSVHGSLTAGDLQDFNLWLAEDLQKKKRKLNDREAFKYLKLLDVQSIEDYYEWYEYYKPNFLTMAQLKTYLKLKGIKC